MLDFKFQQHEAQPAIGLSISTRLGYPISLYVDDYRLGAGGALRDLDPVFTAADVVPRVVEKRYAVPNKGRCITLMVFYLSLPICFKQYFADGLTITYHY
jgi:hypothetical protein